MPRDAAEGQKPHNMLCLRQLHKLKIILKQINLFCFISDLHYLCTYFIEILKFIKNSYIQ